MTDGGFPTGPCRTYDVSCCMILFLFSCFLQVKTTNPKKYCVRPNTGLVPPQSSIEIVGRSASIFRVPYINESLTMNELSTISDLFED